MPTKQRENTHQLLTKLHANAICYSGYREGQDPRKGIFPSKREISEDLNMLWPTWKLLRLYDCSVHAERVIEVIEEQKLGFKIMLGADMAAEVSNPNCPWGANYSDQVLEQNREKNEAEIERLIDLAKAHPDVVFAVSIGNEASVDWTDHLVPVERLVCFAEKIKAHVPQQLTFCENYVPWLDKLAPLVECIDFISIHTYPVWEYKSIDDALAYTEDNYLSVKRANPDIPIVITEAGWTTASNGRGIEPWNASEELQLEYYRQLTNWADERKIITFVFEAFDEPWKGSDDAMEPEKHWGLFKVDRRPKLVAKAIQEKRI